MANHVAIVGGGFSGTMAAVHLLGAGARVTLIEREREPGRGLAYGAADPIHLLNVRAGNMSAYPDDPGHLVQWLEARGVREAASAFAPRRLFGAYVEEQFDRARAAAPERLHVLRSGAEDMELDAKGVRLRLAGGEEIAADAAVLALGNLPPPPPPGLDPAQLGPGLYWGDPWLPGVADGLRDGLPVLVIGTGLTMVDAVLLLEQRGFTGPIFALSRRGLIPHAHAAEPPPSSRRAEPPQHMDAALVREVRGRAGEIGWRHAVDELRPFTQGIWRLASSDQRGRYLRHLRPWWDVHRHRIAPEVAARIQALKERGQLRVAAGKIGSVRDTGGSAHVTYRPRGSDTPETIVVQRIFNCTGPEGNLPRSQEPLLRALLAKGAVRPGPNGIGLDVDRESRVLDAAGTPSDRLSALGPVTRGVFWEIVAVPDIRSQAQAVARRLVAPVTK